MGVVSAVCNYFSDLDERASQKMLKRYEFGLGESSFFPSSGLDVVVLESFSLFFDFVGSILKSAVSYNSGLRASDIEMKREGDRELASLSKVSASETIHDISCGERKPADRTLLDIKFLEELCSSSIYPL